MTVFTLRERVERARQAPARVMTVVLTGPAGAGLMGRFRRGETMPDIWQATAHESRMGSIRIFFSEPLLVVRVNQIAHPGSFLRVTAHEMAPAAVDPLPAYFVTELEIARGVQ